MSDHPIEVLRQLMQGVADAHGLELDHAAVDAAKAWMDEPVVITGARRSGKTFATHQAMQKLLEMGQTVFVVQGTGVIRMRMDDPCDEWPAHAFGWYPLATVLPTPYTVAKLEDL